MSENNAGRIVETMAPIEGIKVKTNINAAQKNGLSIPIIESTIKASDDVVKLMSDFKLM
jgi:hypothetical protein